MFAGCDVDDQGEGELKVGCECGWQPHSHSRSCQPNVQGKSEDDIAKASKLFREIQLTIDSKQLKPFVRTQYMRSAFQMGHDRSVSFTLDTNLVMLKENPEGAPTCAISGRWFRDPALPVSRTEITRFPHAVLEIKLALPEGGGETNPFAALMAGFNPKPNS